MLYFFHFKVLSLMHMGCIPPKTPNFALQLPPLGGRAGVGGLTTVRCSYTTGANRLFYSLFC